MDKVITCNWFYYLDFDGKHTIELQFINHKNNTEFWKIYKHASKEKVKSIAKSQETKTINKIMNTRGTI